MAINLAIITDGKVWKYIKNQDIKDYDDNN